MIEARQLKQVLEPLDLSIKLDDVRGLVMLTVLTESHEMTAEVKGGVVDDVLAAEQSTSQQAVSQSLAEDDEWSHALVHRRRLNLEQSLLVAILRRHYVVHEQEAGIGASAASVSVAEILPQLM